MNRRQYPLLALFCLLTAACDGGTSGRFDVMVVGDPETTQDASPPLSQAAALIREATGSGLVALDSEGRIRPDLAARWIVTDDGQSYIFRVEGAAMGQARWPNALEVRNELRKAIAALEDTGLGRDLDVIDGIYARTNQVVEIRLKTAMPEFLQLLASPELALHFDNRTTDALTLESDARSLTLLRAPIGDEERPASLDLRIAPPREAVERFQRGEADLLLGGGIDALPHVEMGGLLRGTIRLDPVTGLFGMAIGRENAFLSLPANREAVSMAIDRAELIAPFQIGGWTPRTRLVPVGLPGTQQPPGRWADLTIEQRQAIAASRVAGWVATKGKIESLRIAVPRGEGGTILFRRLSADLDRIGLAARRVGPEVDAELRLIDEVATIDRPEWYLHRLDCKVIRATCNADADALVAEAIAAPDEARRRILLEEAEALLTATDGFISFGPPIRFSLVRGGVDGFAINRWGFHPLSQLFADPT